MLDNNLLKFALVDACAYGFPHYRSSFMNAKFREDAVAVSDRGFEGNSEFCRDLFSGETRDQETHHIHFAVGEGKRIL